MQSVQEYLFRRGKRGTFYVRRRIPLDVADAYPHKKREITRSLGTSDPSVAKKRLYLELSHIDAEFKQRREQLALRWAAAIGPRQEFKALTEQQMQDLAESFVRQVLYSDEVMRTHGLDDGDFDALGAQLTQQREELGRMLARGQSERVLPVLKQFLYMSNIRVDMEPEQERRAAFVLLQGIVRSLDYRLSRQSGQVVQMDSVTTPPVKAVAWDEVFAVWRDYVIDRPKATTIACNTAWQQLKLLAKDQGIMCPAHVTSKTMSALIEKMSSDKLAAKTINERLLKIRQVYKIAIGRDVLKVNPAENTLGVKVPAHMKGRDKRQPFSASELQTIFGSPIYTQHLRSRGMSGEASYWIPMLMFYTGARPEELAGLRVDDVKQLPKVGWYLEVTDLPDAEDAELFDGLPASEAASLPAEVSERRHLKNVASRRQIPLAVELERLNFFKYVDWVKQQNSINLFPTLTPDCHGKLSGAHSKFFGRYKRGLGIISARKTLYSLRHNMKDFLEDANMPSRYLKRFLGHTTGDGAVTDNYGSGLPLERMAEYFRKVEFPPIPALPWQVGLGYVVQPKERPKEVAGAIVGQAFGLHEQREASTSAQPTKQDSDHLHAGTFVSAT